MSIQTNPTQEKWDTHYRAALVGEPSAVLRDYNHLLPVQGQALDLACGLGANALLLASRGLETHAWDLSSVAIARLEAEAQARGLTLHGQACDIKTITLPTAGFDVIVCCHYLERPLIPQIIKALRPGGLVFFQTFTVEAIDDEGPKRPEWRLASNELLQMFSNLRVYVYREEGLLGDTRRGWRNKAMIVAQR